MAGDDIGYDLPNVIANLEVHSARHSRVEDFAESLAALSTDGYTLLIEDNAVAVYFNEENASIRVMDKKSGYVWGCLEPGAEANKTWSSVGNGILAVDLVDSKLVAKNRASAIRGNLLRLQGQRQDGRIYRQVHQIWRHHSLYHVSRGRKPEV